MSPSGRLQRIAIASLLAAGVLTLGASVNGIAAMDETLRAATVPAPVFEDVAFELPIEGDCPEPAATEATSPISPGEREL